MWGNISFTLPVVSRRRRPRDLGWRGRRGGGRSHFTRLLGGRRQLRAHRPRLFPRPGAVVEEPGESEDGDEGGGRERETQGPAPEQGGDETGAGGVGGRG